MTSPIRSKPPTSPLSPLRTARPEPEAPSESSAHGERGVRDRNTVQGRRFDPPQEWRIPGLDDYRGGPPQSPPAQLPAAIPPVGSVDYYKQRHDDFVRRNPGVTPPDYYLEYLPTNPWIHRPFEGYVAMGPEKLLEKWKV